MEFIHIFKLVFLMRETLGFVQSEPVRSGYRSAYVELCAYSAVSLGSLAW